MIFATRTTRDFPRTWRRVASGEVLHELAEVHRQITRPGAAGVGRPRSLLLLAWARQMGTTFPNARLAVIEGDGLLFHEERPAEVAQALLPTLLGA